MKCKLTPQLSSDDWKDFCSRFHFSPADLPYIKAIYTALLPLVESCAYYSLDQNLDGISLPHYAYGFVTLGNGIDELSELYLDHEQIQEAYIVDCVSLLLLSKAYAEFAHVIEDQSGLSLAELSFLGDTYSLDLLPQIYERLAPDAIGLTEGPMLLPLKTAALILHLDTNTHADLRQLCNTCSTCKNLSCPSRKSPLQDLPHTYGAMQIFHINSVKIGGGKKSFPIILSYSFSFPAIFIHALCICTITQITDDIHNGIDCNNENLHKKYHAKILETEPLK